MQVKKINQSLLDVAGWAQFLGRSSVIIAAVLLGSALITAIAANWLTWPKVFRVILIQITITALFVFAWQRGLRKPKEWASAYSLSSLSISLAAIAVGGLLALIGQSYQTGADPWWLFALWAALLLPWLITLHSPFIILLVVVLTNTALYLFALSYFSFDSAQPVSLLFIAFNILLIQISGRYGGERVASPVALIAAALCSIYWIVNHYLAMQPAKELWQGVLTLAVLLAVAAYYSRLRFNFPMTVLSYLAAYVMAITLLVLWSGLSLSTVAYFPFVGAPLAAVMFWDLRRLWRHCSVNQQPEPWFLRLMYLCVQLLVTLLVILFYLMVLGHWGEFVNHLLIIMAVGLVVILQRNTSRLFMQDVPLLLLLCSMTLAAVGTGSVYINKTLLMLWFVLLNLVVYYFSPNNALLRFMSAGFASVFALYGWWDKATILSSSYYTVPELVLFLAVVFLAVFMRYQPAYERRLKPLWWAWLGMLSCLLFWQPPQWLLFVALPPVGFLALIAWVWAYAQRDALLFWFAAAWLVFGLGWHYYDLAWPLMQKAMTLALVGVLFAALSWLLYTPRAAAKNAVVESKYTNPNVVGMWLGLMATLLLSSQDVIRKEYLLAKGKPVALALMPVDPRSLMQGDYMALGFQLSEEVAQVVEQDTHFASAKAPGAKVLAYMQSGSQCPSTAVALQNPNNEALYWLVDGYGAADLKELAVVSMQRHNGRWLPNGVDAWFFPEGQAEAIGQAQCGVFKTNAVGQALLYELLVPQK